MDWAEAAQLVSDDPRWQLSDPPDDPHRDDDWGFWKRVQALVESDGELGESVYNELLHPRDRHGRWMSKLHRLTAMYDEIASRAHEGQTDKQGVPYIEHVRAVADSVRPETRGVAYFHDALEDTELAEKDLEGILTPDQIGAVKLLTRPAAAKSEPYEDYIERIAEAPGKAGEMAREVKIADLHHNLGRLTPELERLRPRYEKALARLEPEKVPLHQRGAEHNKAALEAADVEQRFEGMYRQAVASGHAKADGRWYTDAHNQIWAAAAKADVDPHVLTAMVAATSPQMRWVWAPGTPKAGKYDNLEAALRAVQIARRHPDEPASKLAARLQKPTMLRNSLENAVRLYRGEDPDKVLGFPKTRSFYNNLAWPDRATTITIDTLMARAAIGETARAEYRKADVIVLGKGAPSAKTSGYVWVANRVQALADRLGLKPHELQAIIWNEQQRRQDADVEAETARRRAAAAKRGTR